MNQEKYTERMRGFLQSAQMLALREGHQRLRSRPSAESPARRQGRPGGQSDQRRRAAIRARCIARSRPSSPSCPRSKARARARSTWRPRRRALFDQAEAIAEKAGDASSPSSACCWRWRSPRAPRPPRRWPRRGVNAAGAREGDRGAAQGPHGRPRVGRERLRRAEEIRPRPDRRRRATASSIR